MPDATPEREGREPTDAQIADALEETTRGLSKAWTRHQKNLLDAPAKYAFENELMRLGYLAERHMTVILAALRSKSAEPRP